MTDWNPPANVLTSAELKLTSLQWLQQLPPASVPRSKAAIDRELAAERDW